MSSQRRPMANSSGIYRPTYDLFVANLPETISDAVLRDSFIKFGQIASVQIFDSNRSTGKIAYVRFVSQESMHLAAADIVCINSNRLYCSPAHRSNEKKRVDCGSSGDTRGIGGLTDRRNQVATESGNKPDIVSFSQKSDGPPRLIHGDDEDFLPSRQNERVQLFMTHVESPCIFWAQKPNLAEVIANVERSLATVCPVAHPLKMKPEPNKVYGAQFSFDEQWYRCELLRHISETQSEVIYVDYGNKEVVSNNRIVVLPECLMQLNPLASKYCLYGIRASEDPALFTKGTEKLSMLKESVLYAVMFEPSDGVTPVMMRTTDGLDVAQEMLNSKTCVLATDLDAMQINPRELMPQMSCVPPHPPLMTKHVEPKVRTSDGSRDHVFTENTEMLTNFVRQLQHDKASLENQLQAAQRDAAAHVRDFETRLSLQQKETLEYEQELRSLRSEKQVLEAKLSLAAENTLSKKIARVFAGLRNVMLQRAELQSAAGAADPVAEAIAMATGSSVKTSLELVPVLGQIDDVRARYQALQEKLMSTSEDASGCDSVALNQMMSERNNARKELFALLQEFVDLFSDVDALTSHETRIEKLLTTLEVNYASYLASPAVNDVQLDSSSEAYLAWKNGKQQKFEAIRSATDLLSSLVLKSVEKLHEELLRLTGTVDLTEVSIPDLDSAFEGYETALDMELKVTNQDESASDVATIQRTLVALTSELRRMLENVRKLLKLRAQFVDEREELNQWLSESPDIARLQLTSKTVKGLKSKLRHRLVDLQDLQEDGRENSEEFLSAENDLAEIRGQLQQQLEIEDEQMKWLSVLTLNHFPEMIVMHPELNLHKCIKFNGLLKSGYTLDQFQLKPLPSRAESKVYKSTYCGKAVILKEFLVGVQCKTGTSDFLENAKQFSEIMSPHLAQLLAIFFGMNDRQAVVVLPSYEFSLTQLMEDGASGPLPEKAKVLGSVLRGIAALHSVGIVHCSIHPNNVLVNASSGDVVVADYNFAETPMQRCENPFVTSSGLRFQAPELQLAPGLAICEPSFPADMYNFGLLIVWIHDPRIAAVPSSLPDLSSTSLDHDTATLASILLEKQPDRRPGTDKILAVGYFSPDELEEESCATDAKAEAACPSEADDGTGTSIDIPNVETEAYLEGVAAKDVTQNGVTAKDAVEEGKMGKSLLDEQRTSESEVEPKGQSEESSINSKQAGGPAEGDEDKLEDDELGDSCKEILDD